MLRWSPRAFWAATPRELAAAAGLATRRPGLGRAELDGLIAAHPDTKAERADA